MASEAQRLIGISLTKIAQSRSHRGGVSLHKNLLVATVLQKARYIFMEEAYNMVHFQHQQQHQPVATTSRTTTQQSASDDEDLVGITAEEAGVEQTSSSDVESSSSSSDNNTSSDVQEQVVGCEKCGDKENHPPTFTSTSSASGTELTYLDLDKSSSNVLRERSNASMLKRRRAVAEWETEEAVQSILPKRSKPDDSDDSVFLDDATLLSDVVSKEIEEAEQENSGVSESNNSNSSSSVGTMEIDRITSLVSIFNFSMGDAKLNRSMSTPDLCSAQAKDTGDGLQQRPFLAMTV